MHRKLCNRLVPALVLALSCLGLWACQKENPAVVSPDVASSARVAKVANPVFVSYDEPPSPKGGFAAIAKSLRYPEQARQSGIEGRVILNVLVSETGRVDSVMVLKSLGFGCDEAAVQAVRKTGWQPAKQKEQPVAVWVAIPVVFKLNSPFSLHATNSGLRSKQDAYLQQFGGETHYPRIARLAGIEGTALVDVFVNKKGELADISLARSSGFAEAGLDAAALDIFQNRKFYVLIAEDGKPAAFKQRIAVEFKNSRVTLRTVDTETH